MITNLFKHSGIYFFGSLISKVITTVAWIGLARILTPDKYGQFTLYFMILQIVTFTADFGLNQYYLKNIEQYGKTLLFNKIVFVRSFTLIGTSLVLTFILFYFKIFGPLISFILLLSLIPMSYLSISEGYYLEQKKGFRVSLKLASVGGIFLIGYVLFNQNLDLTKTAFILFVSLIITMIWFFPWKEIRLKKIMHIPEAILILKSSSSYAYLTLTSFFYNRGDSFVIAYFRGNTALGIYGLAYKFLESLSLFSSSLTQNLFPLSAKQKGISYSQLKKITLLMFLFGGLFSFMIFFSSKFLIVGLFGSQYLEAIPILKIFSFVLLLFFINAPMATVVQSSKLVRTFLPYGIFNTILNVVLNIIFIPVFGIIAAAWIMLLTELTGILINIYFVRKLYQKLKLN